MSLSNGHAGFSKSLSTGMLGCFPIRRLPVEFFSRGRGAVVGDFKWFGMCEVAVVVRLDWGEGLWGTIPLGFYPGVTWLHR